MNKLIKLLKEKRGSSTLELAAGLMIIFIVIGGIIQINSASIAKIIVRQTAYEALRQAVKSSNQVATAQTIINNQFSVLPGWKLGSNLDYNVQISGIDPNQRLEVNVKYKIPVLNPLFFKDGSNGSKWIESGTFSERLQEGDI